MAGTPHLTLRSLQVSGLFLAAWLGASSPAAWARDDWQLWLEQKWSVGLTKSVKLIGKTEERYRSDMTDFYAHVASVGVSWKARPWLKVEPLYHYEWTEQNGPDTNDNRAVLHLTPNWSWGRVSLEDRHRIEFRHLNGLDEWRYRHKPKISVALGRGWYAVSPYVADELFYGERAGGWTRHRVWFGAEKPLSKAVSAELYYALDSTKQGRDWNELHLLGLSVGLKF